MRTTNHVVEPRVPWRIAIAVLALGWGAVRLHGVERRMVDVQAKLAVIQDETARTAARHELARLERQLDAVASSLEVSMGEGYFVAGDYVRR